MLFPSVDLRSKWLVRTKAMHDNNKFSELVQTCKQLITSTSDATSCVTAATHLVRIICRHPPDKTNPQSRQQLIYMYTYLTGNIPISREWTSFLFRACCTHFQNACDVDLQKQLFGHHVSISYKEMHNCKTYIPAQCLLAGTWTPLAETLAYQLESGA